MIDPTTGPSGNQPAGSRPRTVEKTGAGNTPPPLILTPATDWTGQTYEQRLRLAAETLFAHGHLPHTDWQRIDNRISREADAAREIQASRWELPKDFDPDLAIGCADDALPGTAEQWRDALKRLQVHPEPPLPDQQLANGGACS